ncbi:MAG: hypothetical protein ABFS28_09120, partial [Bacteroidota bacterium]
LEYKFQDEFPTQFPVPAHQLSLGTSFGMTNGSGLRIGVGPPLESFFFNAKFLVNERFLIQAKYINTYFDYGNSNFFSFGLSYRLPAQPETSGPGDGN